MLSIFPNKFKIYDISPTLEATSATFPGDTPFSRTVDLSFEKGNNLLLSHIQTSVHNGAHADAPNHYHPKGESIDVRSLSFYLGAAQVIEVKKKKGRLFPKDFENKKIKSPRLLIKTSSFPNPLKWQNDFCSLSKDLVDFLFAHKVVLVGIDTPSIDPYDDQVLESHQCIYRHKMAILENLVLKQVKPGFYDLIALPLRIKGGDASPVRAVLIKK